MASTFVVFPSGVLLGANLDLGFTTKYPSNHYSEANITDWLHSGGRSPAPNYIVSGLGLSAVAGQLHVNIATGFAFSMGRTLQLKGDPFVITGLTANDRNYVWSSRVLSSSTGRWTSWTIITNITGIAPVLGESVMLGTASTNGTQVTSVKNAPANPIWTWGTYPGDGTTGIRYTEVLYPLKIVEIISSDDVSLGEFGANWRVASEPAFAISPRGPVGVSSGIDGWNTTWKLTSDDHKRPFIDNGGREFRFGVEFEASSPAFGWNHPGKNYFYKAYA